jgi:NAD(P)-dependent dehydrogenase (short-subunit alcohol dehydrogenase family)
MEEIINVNLLSAMVAVSRLKKNLKPNATIVLFGSQSGFKGSFDDGYAITKGAIHALTRTVSLKLAPGNRIVAIAPGIVTDSRMTQDRRDDLALVTQQVPMQRLGHPRELAAITYFVLSDCCALMTGCTIDVNGANYLR